MGPVYSFGDCFICRTAELTRTSHPAIASAGSLLSSSKPWAGSQVSSSYRIIVTQPSGLSFIKGKHLTVENIFLIMKFRTSRSQFRDPYLKTPRLSTGAVSRSRCHEIYDPKWVTSNQWAHRLMSTAHALDRFDAWQWHTQSSAW
jgi:hypothetical protein